MHPAPKQRTGIKATGLCLELFGQMYALALTMLGIVRVRTDDDDEREGKQRYSLEIGDFSMTLDWLAPAAIPFFMGAEITEAFSGEDGTTFFDALIDSMNEALAPLLEMSMLSGLQDMLDTCSNVYDGGVQASSIPERTAGEIR